MKTLTYFMFLVAALVAVIFGGMGYSAIDRHLNFEQVTAEVLTADEICQTENTRNYVLVKTRRTSKWRDCREGEKTGKTAEREMTYARGIVHVRYRSPADHQIHVSTMTISGGNDGAARAVPGRKWEILAHRSSPLRVQPL